MAPDQVGDKPFEAFVRIEEYVSTQAAPTEENPDRLIVTGRTHESHGPHGHIPGHQQKELVPEQVRYYLENDGTHMPTDPMPDIYEQRFGVRPEFEPPAPTDQA